MQQALLLILLFFSTRVYAISIPYQADGNYHFDFSIEVTGGQLIPGSLINGQFRANSDGSSLDLFAAEFNFYDPITKMHHLSKGSYADDMVTWISHTSGKFDITRSHTHIWKFLHNLQYNFLPSTGSGSEQIEGGWEVSWGDPSANSVNYYYDFTGNVIISLHNPANVPETTSTFGLMAAAFSLLIAGRKNLLRLAS